MVQQEGTQKGAHYSQIGFNRSALECHIADVPEGLKGAINTFERLTKGGKFNIGWSWVGRQKSLFLFRLRMSCDVRK